MSRVEFIPVGRSAEAGADETILDAARRAGAPVGNSCGGVGTCGRCRVTIVSGGESLSPLTTMETRIAAEKEFDPDERLACQAVVRGDCVITTKYWG